MKRVSSVVWQFFDRLEENKRCVAVLCKLCDSEYKFFGNTTNLRAHLIKKHPLQWEFRQNNLDGQKTLNESTVRTYADDQSNNRSTVSPKTRKIEVHENSETEIDHVDVDEDTSTLNLVRQMHDNQGSDEEWLEEDYVQLGMFEPTHKKPYRKIKREVISPSRPTPFLTRSKPRVQKTQQIIIDNSNKDEYAVFGEYIANKLRKFKAPRTRGNIQQMITTILWQAEYGLYDDAEAVKRVLMLSVQYSEPTQESSPRDNDTNVSIEQFDVKNMEDSNQSSAY